MRPIVALLMSVLVLANSLLPRHDLAELSRLPRLWQHYQQHRQTATSLSFGEYLLEHYSAGRESHATPHSSEHEDLPLHDCHHAPVPVICALPVLLHLPAKLFTTWPAPAYRPAASPRYSGGHAPARWQPPCA